MTEQKTTKLEREYVIPLRRFWVNVPEYKRTRKAIKAIKIFIAKHMKIIDRNIDNVKLDVYLNNDIWFKGRANPPSKVRVKAIKEGNIVKVSFVSTPEHVKFLKIKHSKIHKVESAPVSKEKKEIKSEEQKTDEKEKEKAVEQQNIKQADAQAKAEKHTTKVKEQQIHRMALKK